METEQGFEIIADAWRLCQTQKPGASGCRLQMLKSSVVQRCGARRVARVVPGAHAFHASLDEAAAATEG